MYHTGTCQKEKRFPSNNCTPKFSNIKHAFCPRFKIDIKKGRELALSRAFGQIKSFTLRLFPFGWLDLREKANHFFFWLLVVVIVLVVVVVIVVKYE